MRVMVGGRTCSAAARSPREMGPRKTTTERAERRGPLSPLAASVLRSERSRWIAAEWRRSAAAVATAVGSVVEVPLARFVGTTQFVSKANNSQGPGGAGIGRVLMAATEKLMEAIAKNDVGAVRALLELDPAAANARGPAGESPLLAAIYRNADQIVDVLARRRALDVFEASAVGERARVEELVMQDHTLVSAYSADGWTPLHLAAFFAKHEVAALLLDHGASLQALSTNYMANTPLHAAVAGKQDLELVMLLVERGADVNARGATGVTALHLAASRGNEALVEFLLLHGASPSTRLDDGKTPAIVAREHGYEQLAAKLREIEEAERPGEIALGDAQRSSTPGTPT
jgi:ankyrin repeat protein